MVVPAAGLRRGGLRRRRLAAWLGDPHRDRHRLRPGDPRRHQHPPAGGAAHVPAHPGRGRRPARDHGDRACSTQTTSTWCSWRWRPCRSLAFCVLVQRRVSSAFLLLPLAAGRLGTGARVGRARHRGRRPAGLHRAGAHARDGRTDRPGLAERLEHRVRPLSRRSRCRSSRSSPRESRSAESTVSGEALSDPVALGVVLGLVLGKTVGVAGSTWLLAHLHPRRPRRRPGLGRRRRAVDAGRGRLHRLAADRRAGVRQRHTEHDHVVVAVLVGSLLAAALAAMHPAAAQPDLPPDLRGRGAGPRRRRGARRLPAGTTLLSPETASASQVR